MDRLRCIEVFAEVARAGSFTTAATRFGISRAAVTKQVAWLERSLGAPLLNRTTKHVGLTEAGMRVLENASALLERYAALANEVQGSMSTAKGMVRVGTPPSFGTFHLLPIVMQFGAQHPDIEVVMSLDDGRSSLVAESLDVSVRIAPSLEDADFVAQSLMKITQVVVGAPDYLRRAGRPQLLADLARHNCLVHTLKSPTANWRFTRDGVEESVRVRGSLAANFGDALQHAALRGLGLSVHPLYMVADDISAGLLEVVLPQWAPTELEIYVIYSSRRHQPARVRHFLDFLRRWAQKPPEWTALGQRHPVLVAD
ncbi:LysR family transcriptional regulator [soil metagenome]